MAAAIQPEKMTSALGFGNPGAILLPRGHARGTFIPVSYTHLDVYKRQILLLLAVHAPRQQQVFAHQQTHAIRSRLHGRAHILHRRAAVSYTHLDVYKRQAM